MSVHRWIPVRGKERLFYHSHSAIRPLVTLALFLPFTGEEKYCWDCGRARELHLEMKFDGTLLRYRDICNGKQRRRPENDIAVTTEAKQAT